MPLNIGMLLIWISFASCLGAVIYGTWYYFSRNPNMRLASRRFEMISLVTCTLSAMLLMYYLLEVRAYYLYVYRFSCETFPLLYKVSAFWAGQEGSLFIWAWFTLVCVALVRMRADDRVSEIVRIAGLFVAAFFILLLVIRSPFALIYGIDNHTWNLLSTNTDIFAVPYSVIESYHAQGMNPLLRNPWMVIHPPVVFLGYATAVIPFGAAAGYLLTNDRQWMKIALPWSRATWLFMTLGIGIGGFWAYEVLGWGAWYWGWDPVETSSLIPWVALTAYLHTQFRMKRNHEYGLLAPALAMLSFILVIFATFVTRSGLWASQHGFATSIEAQIIGVFLAGLFLVSVYVLQRRYRMESGVAQPRSL